MRKIYNFVLLGAFMVLAVTVFGQDLPKETGFAENFDGEIDMEIWDANQGFHDDGTTRIFVVSGDNGALKVEMNQSFFPDGEMFAFTKGEWLLDLSDPANQVASMKIRAEDATYNGSPITELPFQVSLFADIEDPCPDDPLARTRVAAIEVMIPVAATGESEFTEYYFDFAPLIAEECAHRQEQAANVWAILCETVRWPDNHTATYWLDDVKLGSANAPYVPSDDATIHSTANGTLGTGEITDVDHTLSVTAFLAGLTLEDSATAVMLVSSGGAEVDDPNRTDVATGMVVEVTAEDETTMEYAITTDAPTGISSPNADAISLYPNPASGLLNISNTGVFERATISNITGQAIEVIDVVSNSIILDISGYDSGLYMISLESAEYESVIKKFIIQ